VTRDRMSDRPSVRQASESVEQASCRKRQYNKERWGVALPGTAPALAQRVASSNPVARPISTGTSGT
jgi:hypothetical protein